MKEDISDHHFKTYSCRTPLRTLDKGKSTSDNKSNNSNTHNTHDNLFLCVSPHFRKHMHKQ